MTSNSVTKIDPALFQRVDQFFVGLPDLPSRIEIIDIHLEKNGRNAETLGLDVEAIAKATEGYSGREIEEAILSAIRKTFLRIVNGQHEGDVTQDIILEASREIVPLIKSMRNELSAIMAWGEDAARNATYPKDDIPEEAQSFVQTFGSDIIPGKAD